MLQDGSLLASGPYDLPGVRTLAALGNFKLENPPTRENVKAFADMLGRKPVYGEDIPRLQEIYDAPDGIPGEQVMSSLHASGTLDEFGPRNIIGPTEPSGSVIVCVSGATINWMPRRVNELLRRSQGWQIAKVYGLASDTRRCDSPTEKILPWAIEHFEQYGKYPFEHKILQRLLEEAGFAPTIVTAPTLEDQVPEMLRLSPEIANGVIYLPTNANATWVPLRFRRAVRKMYGSFDQRGEQFIFSQDGVSLAHTADQAKDTANHQRPLTVLPNIGRTVEELFLLQNQN
jgi:hypothetical protein